MRKIIGGTTATPMRVSDWNQTNPLKADYIKNKPEVCNVLKGSASGNPIALSDVSPIRHEIGVGLRSKNLVVTDKMLNGNLTKDENGVYKISKGSAKAYLFDTPIPANTPFVISYDNLEGQNSNADALFSHSIYFADGTSTGGNWVGGTGFSNSFRVNKAKPVTGFLLTTYNPSADFYASFTGVQLELGTTATAYTPYVDVGYKEVFDSAKEECTINESTITESGFYNVKSVSYNYDADTTLITFADGNTVDTNYIDGEPFAVGDLVYVEVNGNDQKLSIFHGVVHKYGKNLVDVEQMLKPSALEKDEKGIYRLIKGSAKSYKFPTPIPANTPIVLSYKNLEGYNANSNALIAHSLYFADGTNESGNWVGGNWKSGTPFYNFFHKRRELLPLVLLR